jgi:hypothetical protein
MTSTSNTISAKDITKMRKETNEALGNLEGNCRALSYAMCSAYDNEDTNGVSVSTLADLVSKMESALATIKQVICPPPPCPAPQPCSHGTARPRKQLTEEELRACREEQARVNAERQAKRLADLKKTDEVEFVRVFRTTARRSLTKEEFLDEHGEGVPESKQDDFWAKFLDEIGADPRNGTCEVELEEREDDDDYGNYEVEEDECFPDIDDLRAEFLPDECELCEDGDAELIEDKGHYICARCDGILAKADLIKELLKETKVE